MDNLNHPNRSKRRSGTFLGSFTNENTPIKVKTGILRKGIGIIMTILVIAIIYFISTGLEVTVKVRPSSFLSEKKKASQNDIDKNSIHSENNILNLPAQTGEQPPENLNIKSALQINKLLGTQNSKFAYITLIHGIDNTFRYRGFLYSALMMKKSLRDLGSTADFIVMLGFTTLGTMPSITSHLAVDSPSIFVLNSLFSFYFLLVGIVLLNNRAPIILIYATHSIISCSSQILICDTLDYDLFLPDINLLLSAGIRLFYLPRLRAEHKKANFMEMALLKITPWNLTEYDRIQYFDGDVLPLKNMDCFFNYKVDTFNTGTASPLNSGWFLSIPNSITFNKMRELAVGRIDSKWNKKIGWGTGIPDGTKYRGGRAVVSWDYNGASLDQGLLFHTFALHGTVVLLDTSNAFRYSNDAGSIGVVPLKGVYRESRGKRPIESFLHFTGRNKPWLQNLDTTKKKDLLLWKTHLDGLKLSINSTNYRELGATIPLGLFSANK